MGTAHPTPLSLHAPYYDATLSHGGASLSDEVNRELTQSVEPFPFRILQSPSATPQATSLSSQYSYSHLPARCPYFRDSGKEPGCPDSNCCSDQTGPLGSNLDMVSHGVSMSLPTSHQAARPRHRSLASNYFAELSKKPSSMCDNVYIPSSVVTPTRTGK